MSDETASTVRAIAQHVIGSSSDARLGSSAEQIARRVEREVIVHLEAGRDAALAKIEAVRALHSPFRIYDECEHNHTDEDVTAGRAVNVSEVGYTCQDALMYVACAECCTHDDEQTEDCATYHQHAKNPVPHCPTIRALDGQDCRAS